MIPSNADINAIYVIGDVVTIHYQTVEGVLTQLAITDSEHYPSQLRQFASDLVEAHPDKVLYQVDILSLRAQYKNTLQGFFLQQRALASQYADSYRLSAWRDKAQRARRLLNSTHSQDDEVILQAECRERGNGEAPEDLASLQLEKSQTLALAMSMLDGIEWSALVDLEAQDSEPALIELLDSTVKRAERCLNTSNDCGI
ncbi:hypothetical protein [Vibrio sp. 10N.261.46.A3]|uniref:hypothetical protein n=1 Tax=Vibrio sp. 10N.261.46.A3 TaxID=3229658 RepID=UPI0035505D00